MNASHKRRSIPGDKRLSRELLIGLFAGMLAYWNDGDNMLAQEFRLAALPQARQRERSERPQPRFAERATHRGFEVSTSQVQVVATASMEDARLAAQQATEGWNNAVQLAEHWNENRTGASLPPRAVHVVVDDRPPPDRDKPPLAVSIIGQATQITINLAPGQPSLVEQQAPLRQAAAFGFLHAAQLDRALPQWVCQGLAAYAGNLGAESDGPAPTRPTAEGREDAAQLVQFLIEGNDGRHAAPFFELVKEQLATSSVSKEGDLRRGSSPSPDSSDGDRIEEFVSALKGEFQKWKEDPQLGQLAWAPDPSADEELRQEQKEMLFVLKLSDRFAFAESAAIRTRITVFGKERGATVLTGTTAARPPSLRTLVERITDEGHPPWATIGPDGKLIWNTNADKLRDLVGVDDHRYEHVWQRDRWVLQTQLADGRHLLGWLEPNAKAPQRPLANFAVKASVLEVTKALQEPGSAEPKTHGPGRQ